MSKQKATQIDQAKRYLKMHGDEIRKKYAVEGEIAALVDAVETEGKSGSHTSLAATKDPKAKTLYKGNYTEINPKPKIAPIVGGVVKSTGISIATGKISTWIAADPEYISEETKQELEAVYGVLPPLGSIVSAVVGRYMIELWKPIIKAANDNGWSKFKQLNPDATTREYKQLQEDIQTFHSGNW